MRATRTLISAIVVLAVAANPLAAALMPCCCSGQDAPDCPACLAAAAATTESSAEGCSSCCLRSCDAEPAVAASFVQQAGCGCVKALPPTIMMAQDKVSPPSIEQYWLATNVWSTVDHVVPTARHFIPADEAKTPTGPPLLALYCTWLK